MAFLFGGANTKAPRSPLREQQAALLRGIRDASREDSRAGVEERRLGQEIKRLAGQGHVEMCVSRAKELVRVRAHRTRLATMRGHMTGLTHQLGSFQGTQRVAEVLAKTALALRGVNKSMDPRAVQRMLAEYERQSELLATSQEMVGEGLDGALEQDGEQDATDSAVADVLRGLGLTMLAENAVAGGANAACGSTTSAVSLNGYGDPPLQVEDELAQRLARLRPVA